MTKPEDFDFISNFSTLWAVFIGAILATIGGFTATQLEWYFERGRRERNAALFFGEVLSTLIVLIKFALDTSKIGDPFGPITMRMLRSARREVDIYDRNRESLLDLRDAGVRASIHSLILRIAMPIDNIFDATQEIINVQTQLRASQITDEHRNELEARLATLRASREGGLEFVSEMAGRLDETVKLLQPLARHNFEGIERAVRGL